MNIISVAIQLFVILFAITVHEAAHGWAAYKMGDPTAHIMGRITLNPAAHIDPIGTILLPIILVIIGAPPFGWAKPVPVNPLNLRDPRRDNLLISAAGPVSNLSVALMALICLLVLKALNPNIIYSLSHYLRYGTLSRGYHLIEGLALILFYAIFLNVLLAVFNLIPVPPLDGSGVITGLLSEESAQKYERVRPYGFLIIFGLLYLGILDLIIRPIQILLSLLIFS